MEYVYDPISIAIDVSTKLMPTAFRENFISYNQSMSTRTICI